MMRFLIDAQLSPKLVDWFEEKGHSADHIASVLSPASSDVEIVDLAAQLDAVIVSKDADFIALLEAKPNAPLLLRIRTGNAVNHVLIARLEKDWARAEAQLQAGQAVVDIG